MIVVDGFLGNIREHFDTAALEEDAFIRVDSRKCHVRAISNVSARVVSLLRKHIPEATEKLGIDVGPSVECFLTRYGNGDSLGWHQDGVMGTKAHRAMSWVYYRRIGDYTGGNLVFMDADGNEIDRIEPADDRLIIFDSKVIHRVEPVVCGGEWKDGRFSFNGWIADPTFAPPPVQMSQSGESISPWGPTFVFTKAPCRVCRGTGCQCEERIRHAREEFANQMRHGWRQPVYEPDSPHMNGTIT